MYYCIPDKPSTPRVWDAKTTFKIFGVLYNYSYTSNNVGLDIYYLDIIYLAAFL